MSVVVVATIMPLPEHRDEVIATLKETVDQVHAEEGCELYTLNEAPDRLIMIEKWATPRHCACTARRLRLPHLGQSWLARLPARPRSSCSSRFRPETLRKASSSPVGKAHRRPANYRSMAGGACRE